MTAHGRLSAPPSSLFKTVGSCSRPRASTIHRPRPPFASASSSRRSSADRSRRAISTCFTTACRRPSRRSKNAALSWWRSAVPGAVAASRPRCPPRVAKRRSHLPTASSRRSRRLSALAWMRTATWCSWTVLRAPAKPRSTSQLSSACSRPVARPACSCPRSR